jgi:hypothetical protein
MDPKTLAEVRGIHLIAQPVDEGGLPTLPNGQQGVPRDQAIRAAMDHAPGVDRAHNLLPNVQVSAQYGLFTNDHYEQRLPSGQLQLVLENRPAWVITFSGPGVVLYPIGPYRPGPRPPLSDADAKHEVSVVIDAATGQYLMAWA